MNARPAGSDAGLVRRERPPLATIGAVLEEDAIGVVLAGGAGSRLGGNKATLRFGATSLVERALAVLDEVFSEVVVSLGRRSDWQGTRHVVRDNYSGCGPLAGVEATLAAAGGRPAFVLACDLPRVAAPLVWRVLRVAGAEARDGRPRAWLASGSDRPQPLCGLYSAASLAPARRQLERSEYSMRAFLEELEVTAVDIDPLGDELLLNVNRPGDLERALELLDDD